MIFGSVCSGIEAASAAWKPLGWHCSFMSEIEAFPRAVLKHHYPETPLHGDFTTIEAGRYDPITVLVGGTPCQSFSVAGLRKGMADDRGNLALEYLRLAGRLRPRWIVWENVPGVLSSGDGRDFGSFIGGLGILGYGFAYRVLDAQYFGLAQRRKRVFVVGYLGDWRCAAAVLFERASLSGDIAPRREAGKAAPTIPSRSSAGGGLGTDFDCDGGLIAPEISPALKSRDHKGPSSDGDGDGDGDGAPLIAHALRARAQARHRADTDTYIARTLGARHDGSPCADRGPTIVPVAYRIAGDGCAYEEGSIAAPLTTGTDGSASAVAFATMAVRRLTVKECERLMGFPDGYTDVPYRGKPAADGPRYRALGNSMAVPVMRWIGERIAMVDVI